MESWQLALVISGACLCVLGVAVGICTCKCADCADGSATAATIATVDDPQVSALSRSTSVTLELPPLSQIAVNDQRDCGVGTSGAATRR